MNLIVTIKVLARLFSKVVELHEAGTPKEILNAIHKVINNAYGVVSRHHKNMKEGKTDES